MISIDSPNIRKNTWVFKMVRVRCARRFAAWALILAISVLLGASQPRYFRNFLQGPYDFSASDLDAIQDVYTTPRYFVRVAGSQAADTGVKEITDKTINGIKTGESVSNFYALAVGDKFLICNSSRGSKTTYTGELTPFSYDLTEQFFGTTAAKAVQDSFYPFYLNDNSFRETGYCVIFWYLVLAGLLVWQLLPVFRQLKDPAAHPAISRVRRWGDPVGQTVAAQREADKPRLKAKKGWRITDHFIFQASFFSFDLLRFSDLDWAYKKVTKNSINMIPIGKSYEVILICRDGAATIPCKSKSMDAILELAQQRAPWAFIGFSDELSEFFKKNTSEFISAVEERKRELNSNLN
ncbi:MAG: DUF6709 family protein [bacterium]